MLKYHKWESHFFGKINHFVGKEKNKTKTFAYFTKFKEEKHKEFQISHYKKREWVPYVLEGCSDKEKAFSNWMNRDILFAQEVQRQCSEEQYVSIINDGNIEIDELVNVVVSHFGLG